MRKYPDGVFFTKIIFFLAIFLVSVSSTSAQENQKEKLEGFYSDVALVQCATSSFQDLEKLTVSLENTFRIRILGKMSPHFLLAIIPDEKVNEIRQGSVLVENVFKKPLTHADRESIVYKDDESKFVLGYWEHLMDKKREFEEGTSVSALVVRPEPPQLIDDDRPGTQTEEDLEFHRQRARNKYRRLSNAVSEARQNERDVVLAAMAGFWKAMVNGNVGGALAFFSQQIDPDEMAKITKTLERDRDEILNDKDKGAALKDFTYYLYEFDGQKAKVAIFQEQGLPSSEITFIKESGGLWKIIELS